MSWDINCCSFPHEGFLEHLQYTRCQDSNNRKAKPPPSHKTYSHIQRNKIMTVIAAIKGINRKISRRIRKNGWFVGGVILDRVFILRCLYWYEDGRAGHSGRVFTDTETRAAKPKAQLCWGHKSGSKLIEMWRTRDMGMQRDRCHPEMCWPKEGLGYRKSNEKGFNWNGSALCHQLILAAGTRENLKNFAGERKQGQLLGDNWVIGER